MIISKYRKPPEPPQSDNNPVPPEAPDENPPSLKKRIPLIITTTLLLIVLAAAGFYTYRNIQLKADQANTEAFFQTFAEGYMPWNMHPSVFHKAMQTSFLGKDLDVVTNIITPGKHFWIIGKSNHNSINTIVGCNPFLKSVHARIDDTVYSIHMRKGIFHYVQTNESLDILSRLYNIEKDEILSNNFFPKNRRLKQGHIVFVPGAVPRVFTEGMKQWYDRRKLFAMPTDGWVRGRGFGMKLHPIDGVMKMHKGIDLKADKGTLVFSSMKGKVTSTGVAGGYGKLIVIKHENNFETYYAHLSKIYVKPGQEVGKRKVIGAVGSTGKSTRPHLHFEIRIKGKPVDPMKYLW